MKQPALVLSVVLSMSLASTPALMAAEPGGAATSGGGSATSGQASHPGPATVTSSSEPTAAVDATEVAADALVVRPLSFAATVVGSAIFVVALPFAALAKDVKGTGQALVGAPAGRGAGGQAGAGELGWWKAIPGRDEG